MAVSLANPFTELDHDSRQTKAKLRQAPHLIRLWHLASFDAPTVAVIWALAFAWVAGIRLETWVPLLLACGTWTVYVGDRLLDAHRALGTRQLDLLRERHFFHWRHRRILIPLGCCSGILAVLLIIHRMPVVIRERNSILAAAALMYFSGVHSTTNGPAWLRRIASKELLVGLLFTAGCIAPTLSKIRFAYGSILSAWPLLACGAYFAALAWCNCCAIDAWESLGNESPVLTCTALLTFAGTAASALLAFTHPRAAILILTAAASSFLLLLLDRKRARIAPLYLRTLADAVLLAPALVLVVGVLRP